MRARNLESSKTSVREIYSNRTYEINKLLQKIRRQSVTNLRRCETSLNLAHLSVSFRVVSTFHMVCRPSASQGNETQLADARRHHSSVSGRGSVCDLRGQCTDSVHALLLHKYEAAEENFYIKFSPQLNSVFMIFVLLQNFLRFRYSNFKTSCFAKSQRTKTKRHL